MSEKNGATGRGSDQFGMRFPDGMRDEIAKAAKNNGRSMNAEIIARLESSSTGLSVRDHFAGMAMQARLTGFSSLTQAHNWTPDDFAIDAYEIADAMLKERNK